MNPLESIRSGFAKYALAIALPMILNGCEGRNDERAQSKSEPANTAQPSVLEDRLDVAKTIIFTPGKDSKAYALLQQILTPENGAVLSDDDSSEYSKLMRYFSYMLDAEIASDNDTKMIRVMRRNYINRFGSDSSPEFAGYDPKVLGEIVESAAENTYAALENRTEIILNDVSLILQAEGRLPSLNRTIYGIELSDNLEQTAALTAFIDSVLAVHVPESYLRDSLASLGALQKEVYSALEKNDLTKYHCLLSDETRTSSN